MMSKLRKFPSTFLIGAALIQFLIYFVLNLGMGETTKAGGTLAGILTLVFAGLAVGAKFKPLVAFAAPILHLGCAAVFTLSGNLRHFAYDPNALVLQLMCLVLSIVAVVKARKLDIAKLETSTQTQNS